MIGEISTFKMVIQGILVTRDSGWLTSSKFMVIGELAYLILVTGESRRVYVVIGRCCIYMFGYYGWGLCIRHGTGHRPWSGVA